MLIELRIQVRPATPASSPETVAFTVDRGADGARLWPAMFALLQWGDEITTPGAPRRIYRHVGCGDLGPDGHCAACGRAPGPAEVEARPGPGADPTLRDDPVSVALREPHRLLEPLVLR
jgi:hypothetical protein